MSLSLKGHPITGYQRQSTRATTTGAGLACHESDTHWNSYNYCLSMLVTLPTLPAPACQARCHAPRVYYMPHLTRRRQLSDSI